ncbi:MAG: replication-relaxation family protein [Armatimonadetes bacterium]|nr:replication-relaxation family protein [Armatimonadota bacterium]
MRLTSRDARLVRDLALSHVLSRDQLIGLGYFTSVTRANTRLRNLVASGLVRRTETPFFSQSLYAAGPKAGVVTGERIGGILSGRSGSPRFLQHALCVNNVRLALLAQGASAWRFEQQLSLTFPYAGREYQVRPDGLAAFPGRITVVEADLGHVAPSKFKEKLLAYDAFVLSGECQRHWKLPTFELLTVTSGRLRASRLRRLLPAQASFHFLCQSHDHLGIAWAGGWS